LTHVGSHVFADCKALTSVTFRPPISRSAFITWVVGSSRHRDNWQITTLKHLRNILRLITALALWSRDVSSLDPDNQKELFIRCSPILHTKAKNANLITH
jgi:hypothetical protein